MLLDDFSIHESLSPDEKLSLDYMGYEIIDTLEEGEYELYLCHNVVSDFYQIGMQRKGYHFLDFDQQSEKQKTDRGKGSINIIKTTVEDWLHKYHRIYIDSENKRKSKIWLRILKRLGFTVKLNDEMSRPYIEEQNEIDNETS